MKVILCLFFSGLNFLPLDSLAQVDYNNNEIKKYALVLHSSFTKTQKFSGQLSFTDTFWRTYFGFDTRDWEF